MIFRSSVHAKALQARSKRMADAASIIGLENAEALELAWLRMQGLEARSDDGLDPAVLILRDRHGATGAPAAEPTVSPSGQLSDNVDYRQALSLLEPRFQVAIENVIASQMDPQVVIRESGDIAAMVRGLENLGAVLKGLYEAAELAKANLASMSGAVNVQDLERATVMLTEYLVKTHFAHVVERTIRGDEDSGEAMTAALARMLALIEPGIQAVPEVTADHLHELVEPVLERIISDIQAEPMEERSMRIPDAEFRNQRSDHNVTPKLRALVRASVGFTPPAPAPAPAPQLVQRSAQSAGQTAVVSAEQLALLVKAAVTPLVADLAALKTANRLVTRTVRRAVAPPQVGRAAAAAAVRGGSAVVVRTVETSTNGLPSYRRVYSPKEVARRSYGLPLTERSVEVRPSVFRSRYQPEAQFVSAAARDLHDASFQQPAGVISPGTPARLEGPSI